MVKKTVVKGEHKKQTKQVALHAHHARPYRKRHFGLLIVLVAALVVILLTIMQYRDQLVSGSRSSRNFISDMFAPQTSTNVAVSSSNGFTLAFDSKTLYAVGVDDSGALYQGDALGQERSYTKIQMATMPSSNSKDPQSALTLSYHADVKADRTADDLRKIALSDAGIKVDNVTLGTTSHVTIGDHNFERSSWSTKTTSGLAKGIKANFSVYTTIIKGHAVTIVVSNGLSSTADARSPFDTVIQSLRFDGRVAVVSSKQVAQPSVAYTPSIIDTIMMSKVAAAASSVPSVSDSEKIAALYSPAVAKVYSAYVGDITIDGQAYYNNAYSAGSGSGFFVSKDGYFATNGHVAVADAKNIAIAAAYNQLAYKSDSTAFEYLLTISGMTAAEITEISSQDDQKAVADKLFDKLYGMDDSRFKMENSQQTLFAVLGSKQPDATELVKDITSRKEFPLDSTWKSASRVASDYRAVDGVFGSYHASDVAILKIDGDNFPVTHLGSIDDVTQGTDISILGFPSEASDNTLVDSKTTTATLTTGKVSSKKSAAGSDKKLIETDTTIGHGNSGGPVFENSGSVIGIATYTIDGSGTGGGVYNYIRDIKDLKDLAAKKSITFNTDSQTQAEWEKGMGYFYTAHYSTALKNFEKVKQLYPNHNKADEFIATAKKRIADGQDVVDFPIVPVAIGSIVLLVGIGVTIFLIIRHKKKHAVYKAGITQGTVVPMQPGAPVQVVAVAAAPVVQPVQPPVSPIIVQPPVAPVSEIPPVPPIVAAPPVVTPEATTPGSNTTPPPPTQPPL